MYDIIGDVHGEAGLLKMLLKKMGYEKNSGYYQHPERKAIFVGDFTNRGPEIRLTLQIIRQMVDNGAAFAILGNHEINNILYHLKNEMKEPLLREKGKRYASVTKTVLEYKFFPEEWKSMRKWLRTLPMFIDLGGIRIAHAYWSDKNINILKNQLPEGKIPRSIFRDLVLHPELELSQAILQTTRGVHLVLPPDLKIYDHRKRGHRFFRIRWWESPEGKTFHDYSYESKFHLPKYTIPPEIYPQYEIYPKDAPPVFFGHYCQGRGPYIIGKNLCCVDACVTIRKALAAYRWNGETELNPENLIMVER